MGKVYRIHCNGYSKTVLTSAEAQTYVDWLRGNGCVGKEVEIVVGRGDLKSAVFNLNDASTVRRGVVSAAA